MPSFFRDDYDDDRSWSTGTVIGVAVGALAGLAVGVLVTQRFGGFSALSARIRGHSGSARAGAAVFGSDASPEAYDGSFDEELEERVLEAFRNDPILAERAIDIGSVGEGVIELAGWVNTEEEARHAVRLARGVPDVETVVNRLSMGDIEDQLDDTAHRAANGDPALTESRWEGQQVGTGRPRQGTSADPGRHADPKTALEERWQREDVALRNAAEDIEGAAERRTKKALRSNRPEGSAPAPTGVPKADHNAGPLDRDERAD